MRNEKKIITSQLFSCRSIARGRLGEEVGGLFLQAGPPASLTAASAGVRDSGYDSLRRRLSILDRLMQTHSVWLQLSLSYQGATCLLQNQPAGVRTTGWASSVAEGLIERSGLL